jgi:hypothetical protein
MTGTPKRLQQRAWNAERPRYASLDNPEWVTMRRLPLYFWDDEHNHKRYMRWLGMQLGFEKPADWYAVTTEDFLQRRGAGFLEYYDHSYLQALQWYFPKYDWKPWLFGQAPNGYWHNIENCKKYVRWFEAQKGFANIEGWYGITQDDVYELNGSGLMDHYACSIQRLVNAIYPDHNWKPWLFVQVPKNYWPQKQNRIAYMRWLGEQLGYTQLEDWYALTKFDFVAHHGASLIQFGHKPIDLVRELHPRQRWNAWLFKQVCQGFWADKSARVDYLQWLGKQLSYKCTEDWLQVTREAFASHGGAALFDEHYRGDPAIAARELFPEREWFPWEFNQVPVGFWKEATNCRAYLEWVAGRMQFKTMDDWYRIRRADFRVHRGNGFIKRFKMPYLGLRFAYPDYDWLPWRFENVPVGFWHDESNRRWYLAWLGQQLQLPTADQWQRLSAEQLRTHKGGGLIAKFSVNEIRQQGAAMCSPAAINGFHRLR